MSCRLYRVCFAFMTIYFGLVSPQTIISDSSGSFSSPGYPDAYPAGDRFWFARVSRPGYVYKLSFTTFDVLCPKDFLQIGPDRICGNFSVLETEPSCPGQPKVNREFKFEVGVIHFRGSNTPGQRNIGFEAHYTQEDKNECEDMSTSGGLSCNQYCHNTLGSYYCSCIEGYRLRDDSHTCESNRGDEFVDDTGDFPQALPIKTEDICEEVIIVPPGQTVVFTFESDFVIDDCNTSGQNGSITITGDFENSGHTFCYQDGPLANCSKEEPEPIERCPPISTLISQNANLNESIDFPTTVGSRVTLECKEFYVEDSGSFTWVCQADNQWHEESESRPLGMPHCRPDCGKRIPGKGDPGRIVEGKASGLQEWPWAALIAYDLRGLNSRNFCGGSLINERYVVSAVHCQIAASTVAVGDIEIMLGFVYRSEEINRDNPDLQRFRVVSFILHPAYSQEAVFDNDIAIYKLDSKATISLNVRPICLPLTRDEKELPLIGTAGFERSGQRKNGVVVGWGKTSDGSLSDVLQMASLPLIDRTTCMREFQRQTPNPGLRITENMFCVGFLDQVRDSCGGDSGGAMMWEDDTGRAFLNGIVSFGSNGRICTSQEGFGIYTNVSNFIDFINAATDSPSSCEYPHQLLNIPNTELSISGYDPGSTITVSCRLPFIPDENKFYEWVCHADRTWIGRTNRDAMITNPEDLPRCTLECGRKNMRPRRKRAVGSRPAFEREWPWMAFIDTGGRNLGLRSRSFCGGSLIHPQFVVTSARCTSLTTTRLGINRFEVFLGVTNRGDSRNSNVESFDVIQRTTPRDYDPSGNAYDHDIAVLKLDRPTPLGDEIRPVCLPRTVEEQSLPDTSRVFASGVGWGRTEKVAQSAVLNVFRVPKIQNCQSRIDDPSVFQRRIPFTRNMFCSGVNRGLENFCMMDEGGPLMFRSGERLWYLNGISSFTSLTECHNRHTFGIYTDVARYIDFIDGVINKN